MATGDNTLRQAGEHECTLGVSGASNHDFGESFAGVHFSYGWYTTPTQLLTLRKSINDRIQTMAARLGTARHDWHSVSI